MKMVVVCGVEEYLFRPGMQKKGQYYAIITLNQIVLTSKEAELANKLITIYFNLFKKILGQGKEKTDKDKVEEKKPTEKKPPKLSKKQEKKLKESEKAAEVDAQLDNKIYSALLTGVNRAFPFSNMQEEVFISRMDMLFQLVHQGGFNLLIQALRLILLCSTSNAVKFDFYS